VNEPNRKEKLYACHFVLANLETAIGAYSHATSGDIASLKREKIEAMIWIANWQRDRILELINKL
jgi:hypothetical protein